MGDLLHEHYALFSFVELFNVVTASHKHTDTNRLILKQYLKKSGRNNKTGVQIKQCSYIGILLSSI